VLGGVLIDKKKMDHKTKFQPLKTSIKKIQRNLIYMYNVHPIKKIRNILGNNLTFSEFCIGKLWPTFEH